MALPIPKKTWQYSHTTETGGDATLCCRAVLFKIVAQMLAIGGWTCKGSANGAGVGAMDNVNRWSAATDLVWANSPTNHSWIVLESSALGVQFLIELQADGNKRSFMPTISPGKLFTGGSGTAAPTATDGVSMYDGVANVFSESAVVTSIDLHIMASTDGHSFRVFCLTNSATLGPAGGWLIEKIQGAPAELTCPILYCVAGTNTNFNGSTYPWQREFLCDADNSLLRGLSPLRPAISEHLILGGLGRDVGATSVIVNSEYDGQMEGASALGWLLLRVSVWGYTAGLRGRLGYLADIYHAPRTPTTCDSYPADNSKQFMQFGDFVVPWDGTVMDADYTRTARDAYALPEDSELDKAPLTFTPNFTEPITFTQLGPPAPPGVANREI